MTDYQAVIVGAGPAGIFAALTLAQAGFGPVLVVEQGRSIHNRQRTRKEDILTGWGGAGAFSDGKLTLSSEVGGFLCDLLPEDDLNAVLAKADATWLDYGAPRELHAGTAEDISDMKLKARLAGMDFIPSPVRHIGSDNTPKLLARIQDHLAAKCDIKAEIRAEALLAEGGRITGVRLADGTEVAAPYIICAPGRVGNDWMRDQAGHLGLKLRPNPVDIGVRVECPAAIATSLTDLFYESKLVYYTPTFDDKVRTFCMNPYGEVVMETAGPLITVNGHSYAQTKTDNTNFALLVSATFTDPFDDPITYGRSIAGLANLLGGGVIVQRWGDLIAGRRSTPDRLARCLTRPTLKSATPGDLSYVLPFRLLQDLVEMIEAMDQICPGLADRHTLLYGIEVKFYSSRVELSPELKTSLPGLYVIGDGAGITRGLLQASASGIIAAESILADRS